MATMATKLPFIAPAQTVCSMYINPLDPIRGAKSNIEPCQGLYRGLLFHLRSLLYQTTLLGSPLTAWSKQVIIEACLLVACLLCQSTIEVSSTVLRWRRPCPCSTPAAHFGFQGDCDSYKETSSHRRTRLPRPPQRDSPLPSAHPHSPGHG